MYSRAASESPGRMSQGMHHLASLCHFMSILWYSAVLSSVQPGAPNWLKRRCLKAASSCRSLSQVSCSCFSTLASMRARTFGSSWAAFGAGGFCGAEPPRAGASGCSAGGSSSCTGMPLTPCVLEGPRFLPGGAFGSIACGATFALSGSLSSSTEPRYERPPRLAEDDDVVARGCDCCASGRSSPPPFGPGGCWPFCFGAHMKLFGSVSARLPMDMKFLKSSMPTTPLPSASM
mmetsp:Transcript_88282/g.227648  ORF Transcript_88282/g.227648 Transcript_88282/m.227648 type:complete len:233 (+) Transcript_88282:209-907(+)